MKLFASWNWSNSCTVYSSPCLINAQLRVYLHLFTLLFVQILLKGSREPMLFYYCVQTQIVLQTVRTVSTVVHFRTHRSIALYSHTEFAKFSLFLGRGRIPWFVLSYFFLYFFFSVFQLVIRKYKPFLFDHETTSNDYKKP